MDKEPKYWAFKHKPGENASEEECRFFVEKAIINNYALMQYEYGLQDKAKVTLNWNQIKNVKEGDFIFLRGGNKIYAYGRVRKPRKSSDVVLSMDEIIKQKSHGRFSSKKYNGVIRFKESDVFYEDLSDGEDAWGQRLDVDSWRCYNINGIDGKSQTLYEDGANEYGVLKEMKSEKGIEIIKNLEEKMETESKLLTLITKNKNLILTGAPGTGKTYLARQIALMTFFGKDREELLSDTEKKEYKEQCGFVQFHPSYDYTDFVEGLRPIQDGNGNVGFERKDGVFKEFCINALNNPNKNFVFIIDEINRGEISKIFGELFFSIDPGYRGEKGKVRTQYANMQTEPNDFDDKLGIIDDNNFGHFFVPENVYIIGTMNDIDRSVESMDFAMRRRFAFKEIKAEDRVDMLKENEKLSPHFVDIEKRMRNLNNSILSIQGLGSACQIGASYFLKLENYLVNGQLEESSWNDLWDNHISGLLFEYLRGTPNAAKDLEKLKNAYMKPDDYNYDNDGKVVTKENANE